MKDDCPGQELYLDVQLIHGHELHRCSVDKPLAIGFRKGRLSLTATGAVRMVCPARQLRRQVSTSPTYPRSKPQSSMVVGRFGPKNQPRTKEITGMGGGSSP